MRAALRGRSVVWHDYDKQPRKPDGNGSPAADRMRGTYLGPAYAPDEVRAELDAMGAKYAVLDDDTLFSERRSSSTRRT